MVRLISSQSNPIAADPLAPYSLELSPVEWTQIVLSLSKWGWRNRLTMCISYLADGTHVDIEDASNMASAADRILEAALNNPIAVYPLDVNMGKLYVAAEFFKQGPFTVNNVSP